jgi:hypothetical protein
MEADVHRQGGRIVDGVPENANQYIGFVDPHARVEVLELLGVWPRLVDRSGAEPSPVVRRAVAGRGWEVAKIGVAVREMVGDHLVTVGLVDVYAVVGGAVLPHEGPSGSIGEHALPLPKDPELVPQPDR